MPTGLAAELRAANTVSWDAAVGHPFVRQLWAGSLPRPVLVRYLVQDLRFVDGFLALMGAAVALADAPGPRLGHARQLAVVAGPEDDYFTRALDTLGVPAAERTDPELLAPTQGFLDLMARARAGSYADVLAVLTVAEWLYLDWADRPDPAPADPVLAEWVELHRGPAFTAWVGFLRGELDRVGATLPAPDRARAAALFAEAVDLELAFFAATGAA